MSTLKTTYMGIELQNPIILGASNLVRNTDTLRKAEEAGAGAIVYKSLFEEEIQLENYQLDEKLSEFNDLYYEMITTHPGLEHSGPDEHLFNIRKAKEALSIPVIASLNAVSNETWLKYAVLLSQTGIDGIELNFYQVPTDFNKSGSEVEEEQLSILREIKNKISIPVSVKLSPDYSNILNFIKRLDEAGADAFVIFNSFFQPDIDIQKQKHIRSSTLSHIGDYKKSLRYSGLLFGNVKADICGSHGIFSGEDAVKLLLAGASCVQVVSTVYRNGISHIGNIKSELERWMESKNYNAINEFRGMLSRNNLGKDPFIYKRAQYVDLLLNSDALLTGGTNSRIVQPDGLH
jgi:dihydroorotate dehydrogenase (fumarate)